VIEPAVHPAEPVLVSDLCFAQERMWFLEQLERRNTANHCPTTIELMGAVNVALLQQCVDEIVRRHDALRTSFGTRDGRPVQIVAGESHVPIGVVDLTGVEPGDRAIEAFALAESQRPFSLERLPLMRVTLFRLTSTRHVLHVTTHHIVWDAWSLGVVLRELQELYEDYRAGRPSRLAPLAMQYRDYARAEREAMRTPAVRRSLDFWTSRLDGLAPVQLPTDYPRPRVRAFPGQCQTFDIPADLWAGVEAFCAARQVSTFMFVLAALQWYLSQLAGNREVAIGVPVANRTRREWEAIVGFFVNILVFRGHGHERGTFERLLARVREDVLEAYAHAECPFARVVEELKLVRSLSVGPLFQVMLVYLNTPQPTLSLPGLEARLWYIEGITAKQDLTLTISARPDRVLGVWEYNTELFSAVTIARIARHFLRLLELLIDDEPVSPALLRDAEEAETLAEWNATDRPAWRAGTLADLVTLAQPADRVALVHGDEQITYAALRARVAACVERLRAHGVGPETPVGILVPRSPELIVAMLAVFAAGGACVPIDEDWPAARMQDALDIAQVDLLLIAPETATRVEGLRVRTLDVTLDLTLDVTTGAAATAPTPVCVEVAPTNVAYLTFTSGSTGRPKAVEIPREAVWNGLVAMAERLAVDRDDVFIAVTTPTFDIAVQDWALPLMHGGRVVLVKREEVRDPQELSALLARTEPTFMQATPSLWRMLIEAGWAGDANLQILTGGEALGEDLGARLRAGCREVWNLYGTSETTLWSTAGAVRTRTADLGAPLANTTIHLLDGAFDPLPGGFEGELYIGGIGVARGYARQPALTAARFLPDPFSAHPGERMFRTGDLARWDHDARLRIIARTDAQVKVRGIRIEPAEVESCMQRHPAVRLAAVSLHGDPARLIGYLALQREALAGAGAERVRADVGRWLREQLPEYMVPAQLVILDEFPLTTSGKIDRKRLPPVEACAEPEAEPAAAALLTPVGQEVHATWRRSLGRERIDASDDFFELGGNSILAAQVCLTLSTVLDARVPVRLMFETPVFGEFVTRIEHLRRGEPGRAPSHITPDVEHRFDAFPLTDVQEAYFLGRSGLFELGRVATHSYFELESTHLDVDRFEAVCRTLIQRHDMLRAVFTADGRQRVLPHVPDYAIARTDVRRLDSEARERRLLDIRQEMSHAVHPLDRWPLFDIRATRVTDERTRFHFSLDALICDAFSATLLARECLARYRDPDLRLPDPAISFRDYVLAIRALEDSESYRASERYWHDHLDASRRGPDLPVVHGASREAPRFERVSLRLDAEAWTRIRDRALARGLSPTTVVLAAFSEVLGFWSRTPRFLVNLTLFNRLSVHPDVNALVGDFTSITLLDVDTGAPASFEALASAIQRRLWEDLDHRVFSGIRVLRTLRERAGGGHDVIAPVVFTSTLGVTSADDLAEEWGTGVFSIGQTPQVWLDHKLFEDRHGLGVEWDFVAQLFPAGTIEAMFDAYRGLLRALADREDVWAIDRRVLHEQVFHPATRPDAVVPFDGPATLHELFLAQAREAPSRVAAIDPAGALTYGELDAWSAACASTLASHTPAPEELVAVVLPKGCLQAVAILGILRAGGAYLPIDAGEPEDRRLRMLRNAGVRLAITTSELAASLAWPDTCRVIPLGPREAGASFDDKPVAGERLAYVIHTSGSTGQPKGVMIDHRAAVNTIHDLVARLGLTSADRTLALSALSFDLSVFDCFAMWAVGGAIVYPDAERPKDPQHWADLIVSKDVTIWNTVPALMEMLIDATTVRETPLRWIMLSGDWIPVSLPSRVQRRWPDALVLSLGGATEASIWSIVHPITHVDPSWVRIPYGRALTNQSMWVLNEALEQTPPYVVGEICIGGMGVARGYLNDPVLTNQRFVIHPVSGERLYRTGDLGRYLPDGEIDILGRLDHQVKVNGHRVELAEIEAVLEQQVGVQQAIVHLDAHDSGAKELVAYLVEGQTAPATAATVVSGMSPRLEQRALREFPPDVDAIPLDDRMTRREREQLIARQSYRFFTDAPPRLATIQQWLSEVERWRPGADDHEPQPPRSRAWFDALVGRLKQEQFEGSPFPKYRYPSAGSLYPVQTYFAIPPRTIEGLQAGHYYYDPRAHRLVRIGACETSPDTTPTVLFVAETNAIEDAYPASASRFCALEAGYMKGLFLGTSLRPATPPDGFSFSPSQHIVAAYHLDAGSAGDAGVETGRLLMCVRTNGVHGVAAGLYVRDAAGDWVRPPAGGEVDPEWFGRNRDLFERCHFALFSIAGQGTKDELIDVGVLGQILMETAPAHEIGLCPLGEFAHDCLLAAAGLEGSIAHGWVCGRIDPAQTLEWMALPRPPRGDALVQRCRERAARHLPTYMHPARYLFLDHVPLTSNHKVDRSKLRHHVRRVEEEPAADRNGVRSETEQVIAAMLEGILERPVSDLGRSFFEMGVSSLIIVRLYALINARYPERVSFQNLFDHASVREIGSLVDRHQQASATRAVEVVDL
jgi:amino acid adenylation domain-containing protein